MIFIPDANFLISALIRKGKTFELFEWNDFRREIRFVAPEELSVEVRKHFAEIVEKSGLSVSKVIEILDKIESQIEFVLFSKIEPFISEAIKISPPNDFPYVALALFLKSQGVDFKVLTNDKNLLGSLSKNNIRGISIHELLIELNL